MKYRLSLFLGAWFLVIAAPIVRAQTPTPETGTWPMAGHDNQRTSHTLVQVDGDLTPVWYANIEPYFNPKTQVVAANNLLYVATAKGLYAIDATAGTVTWVFPTELPLGHSPTIVGNLLYVGGMDHKLYCLQANPATSSLSTDTATGYKLNNQPVFTFEATQGFDTNPLVANNTVYIGNRDGKLYAIDATTGSAKWSFPAGGPISYSAALSTDGSTIYFAADDAYAYAVNTANGTQKWKSAQLYGSGFRSWWPVVYTDPATSQEWVIFSGAPNYRFYNDPDGVMMQFNERDDLYPKASNTTANIGTLVAPLSVQPGPWAANTHAFNFSQSNGWTTPVTEYLEEPTASQKTADPGGLNRQKNKPWRRTYFVLNGMSGAEYTTDYDADGQKEYAPFTFHGTRNSNRFPPIIGADNLLYQATNYLSDPYIAGGSFVGWKFGTPYASIISSHWFAVDEPIGAVTGGNRLYYVHNQDCSAGSIDLSKTNPFCGGDWTHGAPYCPGYSEDLSGRQINYWSSCGSLHDLAAGYDDPYYQGQWGIFSKNSIGTSNGYYSNHGNVNPFIPYKGKLYSVKSNSIMAIGVGGTGSPKPKIVAVNVTQPITPPSKAVLQQKLQAQITKMISAGHLRPGYHPESQFTYDGAKDCGYDPNNGPDLNAYSDYFHNPADTIYYLTQALPLMPDTVYPGETTKTWKTRLTEYIQGEFNTYKPYNVVHVGWNSGAQREIFISSPELVATKGNFGTRSRVSGYTGGWTYPPFGFYAMWQYAKTFGFSTLSYTLTQIKALPLTIPTDAFLQKYPEVHNAVIAGYQGLLGLQQLGGDTAANINATQTALTNLLAKRASFLTINVIDPRPDNWNYCGGLNAARNFMWLTPETADYLKANAATKVVAAYAESVRVSPWWFVANFTATMGEGTSNQLYDYGSIFPAKAMLFDTPYETLTKYLDVPGFDRGDLFYINNLVTAINATGGSPPPLSGDFNGDSVVDWRDWLTFLPNFNQTNPTFKFVGTGLINIFDVNKLIGLLFK